MLDFIATTRQVSYCVIQIPHWQDEFKMCYDGTTISNDGTTISYDGTTISNDGITISYEDTIE
jgi:hypothetical protein